MWYWVNAGKILNQNSYEIFLTNQVKNQLIIETIKLCKIYNVGQSNEVRALDDINLNIKQGELISIMGSSGSGKTTLLNILGGLDTPSSGQVFHKNIEIANLSDEELTILRRDSIGFIFQNFNLIQNLTNVENIELPMFIAEQKFQLRRKRALKLLTLVGLEEKANNKPYELSGGQKQRVAIARSLANNPSLVLADEPTGNLDSETGLQILELIKENNKKENQTIIIVTHNPEIAEQTQKTYHIRDGLITKVEFN